MKLTFKTERPTGRWRSFSSPTHAIKLDGKEIGSIEHESWRISIMVYKTDPSLDDGNTNCKWRWITLKVKPGSLDDAKKWVSDNFAKLSESYSIHKTE